MNTIASKTENIGVTECPMRIDSSGFNGKSSDKEERRDNTRFKIELNIFEITNF